MKQVPTYNEYNKIRKKVHQKHTRTKKVIYIILTWSIIFSPVSPFWKVCGPLSHDGWAPKHRTSHKPKAYRRKSKWSDVYRRSDVISEVQKSDCRIFWSPPFLEAWWPFTAYLCECYSRHMTCIGYTEQPVETSRFYKHFKAFFT